MKKVSVLLCLVLVLCLLTSSVAFGQTVSDSTQFLSQNAQSIRVTAPAPEPDELVVPMDVQPPWTLSYTTSTCTAVPNLLFDVVMGILIAQFGGNYSTLAGTVYTICSGTYDLYQDNLWEKVYYYWQPSSEPGLPYYVKQFVIYYAEPSHSTLITTSTRYYYSNMPF